MMHQYLYIRGFKMRIKKILSAIAFIVVLTIVFNYLTELYRPSAGYDRAHIIAFEEQKDLDVVYIGGSACFVYWQPLNAWKNYGITSYDYATNGLEAANIEYMIRNSEKNSHKDLYIIGVRPFQLWSEAGSTGALRYVTDSWSIFSPYRYELINSFFDEHNTGEKVDYPSYWFDISYYHDNATVLQTAENWQYNKKKESVANYGWEWIDLYQYLEAPVESEWRTDERETLLEGDEKALRSLCEYCSSEKLNVLFVVCPYYIEQDHEKKYNTIEDIVSEYGFDFLNANEYYSEMNIDFSSDYYNRRHVNCFGAEKYTLFLGKYITEKYDLEDHRGESGYESWDEDYARFASEEEQYKNSISLQKDISLQGFDMAKQMQVYTNISDWYIATGASRYTLFIYNNGLENGSNDEIKRVCEKWGIRKEQRTCNIISGGEIKETEPIDDEMLLEGVVGQDSPTNGVAYSISKGHIVINGKDYYENEEGLIVVVVDNPLWLIADSIILKTSENGYFIQR